MPRQEIFDPNRRKYISLRKSRSQIHIGQKRKIGKIAQGDNAAIGFDQPEDCPLASNENTAR
jgi:hypothetical protein